MNLDQLNPLKRPPWVALLVFFLSLLISALLLWRMEQSQVRAYRADVENLAQNHSFLIRDTIDQALGLNYALASMIRAQKGSTSDFERFAREVLPFYASVSHLSLSPDGVIRQVYPLAGNEVSLGFNQLGDQLQSPEARLALESGKLTLAGPLSLIQGGLAIVGRLPVFLEPVENGDQPKQFWGFTNVTIRMDRLLATANLDKLNERKMAYRLWRQQPDGNIQEIASYLPETLKYPVDHSFAVPNGTWVLSVSPQGGWHNGWILTSKVLLALLLSVLLGYQTSFMAYLQKRKLLLERVVSSSVEQVNNARVQLQATLDAIPDLLFEISRDGMIHGYHTRRDDLLLVPSDSFVGKHCSEFLPSDANAVVDAALAEAEEKGISTGKSYSLELPQGRTWFELSVARKAGGGQGESARFVMISRDISERRRADEELRVAATAFEAREGMMITSPSARILRVNKAFSEITGYSAEQAVGQTPRLLRSERHPESFYRNMWQDIAERGNWRGEVWNHRPNGEDYPVWLTITAVKDEQGHTSHYVSTLTDITERKASEARINHLAFYDSLTELPNRRLLQDRLDHALATSARMGNLGAIIFIDLDDFKTLNDNRGHHIGDLLLVAVAKRLRDSVRQEDTVGRLGGDEFLVVLEGLSKDRDLAQHQVQRIAEKILALLNAPYSLEDSEYVATPSLGITLFDPQIQDSDELLKQADQAMYQAKASGRNTYRFFDPQMQSQSAERFALQAQLREALASQQFTLFYQPQMDREGQCQGAEALIRWQHPKRGLVSPLEFIPLAEESGLILPLGQWILEAACAQLLSWATSPATAKLNLSINISARQFQHPQFVAQLLDTVERTGIDPRRLKLELTESMLLAHQDEIITKMNALKARGIKLSLDDFGTGYSSLAYLKRLPIDELKIDKSFVRDILVDPNDAAIALTIIRLAQSMDLNVIAEGVETLEQRNWLEQQGCYRYQGYYFGKPVAASEFAI